MVVTGSYDKVVRIWTKSEGGDDAEDVSFDVSQVGNYLRDINISCSIMFMYFIQNECLLKCLGVDLSLELRDISGGWIRGTDALLGGSNWDRRYLGDHRWGPPYIQSEKIDSPSHLSVI